MKRRLVAPLLLAAVWLALPSPTFAACDAPEARQFDFWIGEWNVVNKRLTAEGWAEMGRSTARVYPVLDGCALVEQWRGWAWGMKVIGFSVRSYNPETGKWFLLLNWPNQDRQGFGTLEGAFTHGRGEFFTDSTDPQGNPLLTRYTFSDIRGDSFRWDGARSQDGGRTWLTFWVMEFSRRDPMRDLPLDNGPWIQDGRDRWCSQPEAAALDHLHGGWQGTETSEDGEERSAKVTVTPILEGCAAIEHTEVSGAGGDEGYERFAVRSFIPADEHWLQYEMDSRDPVLRASTGVEEDGAFTWVPTEESGEGANRVRWSRGDDDTLVRESSFLSAAGSWTVGSRLELRQRAYGAFAPPGFVDPPKPEPAAATEDGEDAEGAEDSSEEPPAEAPPGE